MTNSYRYFMDTNLFDHINIDKKNTFVASGMGDFEANARELEEKVREGGAADLQLLGIGNNGHIAFNEASDHLIAVAHTEKLTESTINANARFFEKKEDVPTMAITMGMGDILAAKKVVLAATGLARSGHQGADHGRRHHHAKPLHDAEDARGRRRRHRQGAGRRRGLQSLTPTAEKRRCSGPPPGNRSGPLCFSQQKNRPAAAAFAARKRVASYSLPPISCSASFEACRKGALKIDFYLYSG